MAGNDSFAEISTIDPDSYHEGRSSIGDQLLRTWELQLGPSPKDCSRCPLILMFQFSLPCRSYERAIMRHKPHNFMENIDGMLSNCLTCYLN